MLNVRLIGALVGVTLATTGCGAPAPAPLTPAPPTLAPTVAPTSATAGDVMSRLYAEARTQGAISMQAPTHVEDMQVLVDLFHKTYPDITINYQSVESGNLVSNLRTQQSAQNVQIDLASVGMDRAATLQQAGAMQTIDWPSLGVPPEDVVAGAYVKWYDFPHAVAYNKNNVSADEVPKTWDDLLKPRWSNGKIAHEATSSYAVAFQLDNAWGRDRAVGYATELAKQQPIEEQRADLALQAIITGEADVATVGIAALLLAQQQGAPIDIAPVSPQMSLPFGFFIPAGAHHVAGAELFGLWFLTPEARAAFAQQAKYAPVLPCTASEIATYICAHGIQLVAYQSFDQVGQTPDFVRAYQSALGVIQGAP